MNLGTIYLTNSKNIKLEEMFSDFGSYDIYHQQTYPTIFVSQLNNIYVPGKSQDNFDRFPKNSVKEMWQYEIDKQENKLLIKPLISDIIIDNVIINGSKVNHEAFVYNFSLSDQNRSADVDSNSIDVIVEYTLHGIQRMQTHYTPEFNASVPRSDLSEDVSGIEELGDNLETFVEVFSINGQIVYCGRYSDIPQLPDGIYIYKFSDGTTRKKVVY